MVRQFCKQYRSLVCDPVTGEPIVQYHRTKKEAEAKEKELRANRMLYKEPWAKVRTRRKSGSKGMDLPVGFQDKTRINSSGNEKTAIACYFELDGKNKVRSKAYGDKRTREEAISELITDMHHLFKNKTQ